jgi:oxygen-independent coproporphyrinogen-3 oxidase
MKTKGLYLHIPFCDAICVYCDFVKMVRSPSTKHAYMEHLMRHVQAYDFTNVDTIYIGGGTPTSVDLADLVALLGLLPTVKELTLEANPEHINEVLLEALRATNVTRISLGVQSFNDTLLTALHRTHTAAQAKEAIRLIQATPLRLSIDLIYNLPDQTADDVAYDARCLDGIDHVSWYSLILEPNTLHYTRYLRGEYTPSTQDDVMMEQIHSLLLAQGFRQYEISNFTKDEVSHHNMHYWLADNVDAIGLGATGSTTSERYRVTRDLATYLASPTQPVTTEARELEAETLMVGLRLIDGIDKQEYQTRFGRSLHAAYPAIERVIAQGLLEETATHVRPTQKGVMLNNEILIQLL